MSLRSPSRLRPLATLFAVAFWSACQETAVTAVDVAFVEVTPETETLRVGDSRVFQARARDAAGTELRGRQVQWSVVDENLAHVDGAGRLTAMAAGSTRVLARIEGAIGEGLIEITAGPVAVVDVVPATATIPHDGSVLLQVTLRDEGGVPLSDRAVTFSSENQAVATVDASGLVSAEGPGTALITAAAEGRTGTATITVLPEPAASISIDPTAVTIALGASGTLQATPRNAAGDPIQGHTITWTSAAPDVATVEGGVVTGVSIGTATITAAVPGATAQAQVTVSAQKVSSVAVTPPSATLFVSDTIRLTAVARAADGNPLAGRSVTWRSTAPAIATVDPAGVVSGIALGNVEIIATSEGVADTATIFVREQPVLQVRIEPAAATVVVKGTIDLAAILTAGDGTVVRRSTTWSSADAGIATVDGNGRVTGVAAGATTITATSEGKSGTAQVTVSPQPVATVAVTPPTGALFVGETLRLAATARAADGTVLTGRQVSWTTTNAAVASVDANGLVAGLGAGSATITATLEGVAGSATITVAIRPDTQPPTVPAGVTATPASPTQINLSWGASTDNVGVTGYRVYRNGVEVATTASRNYSDVGLTASTQYTYTVAALDAAGNASAQSASVQATTLAAPDTQAPTTPTGLAATAASPTQINLSWAAATDNVGVTGYRVFRNNVEVATTSSRTFSDAGLSGSTQYSYRVSAFDAAGNTSPRSAAVQATTLPSPDAQAPTAPPGLAATPASPTQINLSWGASTDNVGVTGYRVFRNGTEVATTASRNYSDTGLSPSTLYSYRVSAFDAAGNNSPQSAAVQATTQASPDTQAPTAPTGLAATPASPTQINLTWGASTDNVGVTGYRVFRNGTEVATTVSRNYSDAGLNPSTQYSYRVSAFDAAGNNSPQSAQVQATTLQAPDTQAPSTPTGLAAAPASPTQINLSWTAATDNVGVTGYRVFRNSVEVATTGSTNYSDTGLTAATQYTYHVSAFDAAGNNSPQSAQVQATTLQAPDTQAPSTPTALTAAPASPTQINLSWGASTDNVGVTGYRIFRDGVEVTTTPSTNYSDTGLTAATQYSYTVAAFDAAGNASPQSSAVQATTPPAPDTQAPTTPAGLAANPISSTEIELSWSASTDNVGVTGYQVFRDGVQVGAPAGTTFTDAGLTPATQYSYTVAAVDAANNVSPQSPAVQAATQPAPDTQAPTTPAGLAANPISSTEIELSWTASTDNVGVTGYQVFRDGVQVGAPAGTTFTDAGLTPATAYSYTVAAVDAANNVSPQSTAVQATTQPAPDTQAPTTPTGLAATPVSSTAIDLSWTASTDNVAVTGYRVFRDGVEVGTSAGTSFSDTGLTTATTYSYTVEAFDAAGNTSPQSAAVTATTTVPSPAPAASPTPPAS